MLARQLARQLARRVRGILLILVLVVILTGERWRVDDSAAAGLPSPTRSSIPASPALRRLRRLQKALTATRAA